jgi:hypothetical protein
MGVWSIPGAPEKPERRDLPYSYRDPSLVPLAEKAKACWEKSDQGIRQIGLVSLVEEMPTVLTQLGTVGRSDKGGPTV